MPPRAIEEMLGAWQWKARVLRNRVSKWQRTATLAADGPPPCMTLVGEWQGRTFECVAKKAGRAPGRAPPGLEGRGRPSSQPHRSTAAWAPCDEGKDGSESDCEPVDMAVDAGSKAGPAGRARSPNKVSFAASPARPHLGPRVEAAGAAVNGLRSPPAQVAQAAQAAQGQQAPDNDFQAAMVLFMRQQTSMNARMEQAVLNQDAKMEAAFRNQDRVNERLENALGALQMAAGLPKPSPEGAGLQGKDGQDGAASPLPSTPKVAVRERSPSRSPKEGGDGKVAKIASPKTAAPTAAVGAAHGP